MNRERLQVSSKNTRSDLYVSRSLLTINLRLRGPPGWKQAINQPSKGRNRIPAVDKAQMITA